MSLVAMAMALFFSAIPKIFGFLVILFVGWLVALLAEKAVAAVLRTIKVNGLTKRSGLADFVNKMGAGTDPAGVLGAVVKWFIRLIALVVAFDALGLPAVSDVLRQLLLWLPNVVVALVVLVIGGLLASALGNVVRGAAAKSALGNPELLAKVASELVWAFAIVEAVNQIGIATALVNTLFMVFMAVAIAVALGLAFVFGRRETAAEIVRNWSAKDQQNQEKLARAADEAGADISRKAAQ